jgi:hypothetical protein
VREARSWHAFHGSTRRWDRKRLLFDFTTNRAVTLTKNASVPLLLGGFVTVGMLELAWRAGPRGLWRLMQAVSHALSERKRVSALVKVSRWRVERRWTGRDDP